MNRVPNSKYSPHASPMIEPQIVILVRIQGPDTANALNLCWHVGLRTDKGYTMNPGGVASQGSDRHSQSLAFLNGQDLIAAVPKFFKERGIRSSRLTWKITARVSQVDVSGYIWCR